MYQNLMVNDFPAEELKDLNLILDLVEQHKYQCFGLVDRGMVYCYAFVAFGDFSQAALLDYLAVKDTLRDKGYGSHMLEELEKYYGFVKNRRVLIVEAEDPDSTEDIGEKYKRQNRLYFYRKNGFTIDEHNRPKVNGVGYRLFYKVIKKYNISTDEEKRNSLFLVAEENELDKQDYLRSSYLTDYRNIYMTMLPMDMYDKLLDYSDCAGLHADFTESAQEEPGELEEEMQSDEKEA